MLTVTGNCKRKVIYDKSSIDYRIADIQVISNELIVSLQFAVIKLQTKHIKISLQFAVHNRITDKTYQNVYEEFTSQ